MGRLQSCWMYMIFLVLAAVLAPVRETPAATAGNTDPGSTMYQGYTPLEPLSSTPMYCGTTGGGMIAIDSVNGYGYFAAQSSSLPVRLTKVALGAGATTPTVVGSVDLAAGENYVESVHADPASGQVYVLIDPGRLVKFSAGAGSELPTRLNHLSFGESVYGAVDVASGCAYLGSASAVPARVYKVALGDSSTSPTIVSTCELNAGEGNVDGGLVDSASGYLYLGASVPTAVIKLALRGGAEPPVRVAAMQVKPGAERFLPGFAFAADDGRHAFIGMANGLPPYERVLLKFALGDDDSTPTEIAKLYLGSRLGGGYAPDPRAYRAYACTTMPWPPGRGIVDLGRGAAAPSFIGPYPCGLHSNHYPPALYAGYFVPAIDSVHGYIYVDNGTALFKCALPPSDAPGPVVMNNLQPLGGSTMACLDTATGHGYFGSIVGNGSALTKLHLNSQASAADAVSLVLPVTDGFLQCMGIDNRGYAYLGTSSGVSFTPNQIIKLSLGTGANKPMRLGSTTLRYNEGGGNA